MKAKYLWLSCFIFANLEPAMAQSNDEQTKLIQKNIVADHLLLKVFETGNVALLDDIISPKFVNHTATGDQVGIENLKTMVTGFYTNFKPKKIEVVRQLSDAEYVADWVKFIGENPKMVIEGIEMTRYQDGKAVEHWFFPNSQRRAN